MSVRSTLAPLLVAANRLIQRVRFVPAGAVRLLILHDIPPGCDRPLCRLLDSIITGPGFVTPAQAQARLTEAPNDGLCPVLLTFDDGFASNGRVAREILAPRGVIARFFVCPGLIDLPSAEARRAAIISQIFRGAIPFGHLPDDMDLLSWNELHLLRNQGHSIDCHGFDHTCLNGLSPRALEFQIAGAKARLDQAMGQDTSWFAFPFGDMASLDQLALTSISHHFSWCRSGVRGTAHSAVHPLAIPAESIDLSSVPAWTDFAAEGGLAPLYRRSRRRLTLMAEKACHQ